MCARAHPRAPSAAQRTKQRGRCFALIVDGTRTRARIAVVVHMTGCRAERESLRNEKNLLSRRLRFLPFFFLFNLLSATTSRSLDVSVMEKNEKSFIVLRF